MKPTIPAIVFAQCKYEHIAEFLSNKTAYILNVNTKISQHEKSLLAMLFGLIDGYNVSMLIGV